MCPLDITEENLTLEVRLNELFTDELGDMALVKRNPQFVDFQNEK